MEKEQFDQIKEFAQSLTQKRQVMADGQLLDQCQQYLNELVAALADEFEEAPHENERIPETLAHEPVREASPLRDEPQQRMPDSIVAPPEPEPHHHRAAAQQHHKKATSKKHR